MAKLNGVEKLSYVELAELRNTIDRLMAEKQQAERAALKEQMAAMAKAQGLTLGDLFGRGRKGSVAVKYRDPKNPDNTWTGRGRMPRWLAAATKGGKAKKEDFLV